MSRIVFLTTGVLLGAVWLADPAMAQAGRAPLPGIPIMSTVDHPAMALQSGLSESRGSSATGGGSPARTASTQSVSPGIAGAAQKAREFSRTRVEGKALARSVDKVLAELQWFESLRGVRTVAAQRGRPILWIQALGDLDGYC